MNFSCFRNALIKSTEFLSYPFFLVLGTCNYKSRQNSCQFQHNNLFKTHDLLPIRLNYFLKPCNIAKSHVLHLPQNHYITVTEHTSSQCCIKNQWCDVTNQLKSWPHFIRVLPKIQLVTKVSIWWAQLCQLQDVLKCFLPGLQSNSKFFPRKATRHGCP